MFTIAASWPWGSDLRAWANDHGTSDLEVVLIRDRIAAFDDGDVVCLALGPAWVDQSLAGSLLANGSTVVGVFASDAESKIWESWGVDSRMSALLEPAQQLALLERLRRPSTEPVSSPDAPAAGDALMRLPLVVGGAPGAGAREVGVNLAAQIAGRFSTVVIDANESGGGVAQRLGYGDDFNVLDASEYATAGRDLCQVTSTTVLGRSAPFDVIAGLPADVAWSRWPPADAVTLVDRARYQWTIVVVVTSPIVEDLRRWGDRYGVSRALLSSPASGVVAVIEASARGVVRGVDWFAQAQPVGRVPVIINKVPARSPHVDAQIRERLLSILGEDRIDIIGSLPHDRAVFAAEWNATLPTTGRFVRAVKSISSEVAAVTARRREPAWRE